MTQLARAPLNWPLNIIYELDDSSKQAAISRLLNLRYNGSGGGGFSFSFLNAEPRIFARLGKHAR